MARKKIEPTIRGSRNDGGMTSEKLAQRNNEIVAAKLRGLSWPVVADTFGISVRQGQQIMRQYRESNPSLREHDPVEIVDNILDGYQGTIEELALISANSRNDSVRVGAINAKMAAMTKTVELLQAVGVLPHDLGELRVVMDGKMVAESLVEVLNDFRNRRAIPGEAIDELEVAIIEALEGRQRALPAST
jgi:hypothetical protein